MASTSSSTQSAEQQYWRLAKDGIKLLINNRNAEAVNLFKNHSDNIQMAAGYSFAIFMDALMSFEDDKVQAALAILKETEKKCVTDIGWLKSVKSKVFGSKDDISAESLENQIILADTQVCMAILIFLQQELGSYLKGGWVLRKAFKVYQHTYVQILNLHKQMFGDLHLPDPTDFEWSDESQLLMANTISSSSSTEWLVPSENCSTRTSSESQPKNGTSKKIDPKTISRLMGAVCFGYGVLQLGISLLPPSLLKMSSYLGFEGNRTAGISNLMYARKGSDMRAPLAILALLWYHTIVRPFYALDGSNVKAGVDTANLLLNESNCEYGESALFLFFKGRVYRLNSNISQAIESFQASINSSPQREIILLALYEIGWCYLMQLNYIEAEKTFQQLKTGSRWSRSFYSYLLILCTRAQGYTKDFNLISKFSQAYGNLNHKGTQLEIFLHRRFKIFPVTEEELDQKSVLFWSLLIYELLLLWNTLPNCSGECLDKIITDCDTQDDEPMPGLAKLIQGECYNIKNLQSNAINSLRTCLQARQNLTSLDHIHISAFAEFALGDLLIKSPQTLEEGKNLLQHASNYKDYDFDSKLQARIELALKYIQ